MILKNMYIWFEEYGIRYICTQYIRFEEYDVLTGMNGDLCTLVDRRGWTDGTRWTNVDGHWTKADKRWMEL